MFSSIDEKRKYFNHYYNERIKKYKYMLGNKCAICGTSNNLEFDHIDFKTKKFNISKCLNYKESVVLEELKKCQLLCHIHHKEKSDKEISIRLFGRDNITSRGAFNHFNVLSEIDVHYIRMLYIFGYSLRQLANMYNVSKNTIFAIIHCISWKWLKSNELENQPQEYTIYDDIDLYN
jgi:hypothetical protein